MLALYHLSSKAGIGKLFCKEPGRKYFRFRRPHGIVSTTQLCHCDSKVVIDGKQMGMAAFQ